MRMLDDLDVGTEIWPMPVEIPGAIPFPDDRVHDSYDRDAVHRFWLALVEMDRVFKVFRTRFVGKSSPVHLFWGALDLASTRFSGEPRPPSGRRSELWAARDVGGVLPRGQQLRLLAGPAGRGGRLLLLRVPDPPAFRDSPHPPAGARWDDGLGEFILPTAVAPAADPDAVLLEFLQSTYDGRRQYRGLGPGRARTSELSAVGSVRGGYVEPQASFGRRPGSRG